MEFAPGVKGVSITMADPDFPGNRMVAFDSAGAQIGTADFDGDGQPGRNYRSLMRHWTSFLAVLVLAADVSAQGAPGKNVQLDVKVVSVVRQADTTIVTYVLTNKTTSTEALFAFTVLAPTVLTVSHPQPAIDWVVLTRFLDFPVARWGILTDSLAPGVTGPPLMFKALGMPAIVDAWVTGHYELPVYADAADAPVEDPVLDHSATIRVLGVGPAPPGATSLSLTVRLSGLRAEACALGWVDNNGICNSLQVELNGAIDAFEKGNQNAALNKLDAFIHELDAQRGKHVSEAGYLLLKVNADVIKAGAGA